MKARFIDEIKNQFLCDIIGENIVFPEHHLPEYNHKISIESKVSIDILLLDISLSMDEPDYPPSRLDGAKNAALEFIVFSKYAKIISNPLKVAENSDILVQKIQRLTTMEYTNTASGLIVSRDVLQQFSNCRNKRIILLTDGHSNEGGNPEPVAEKIKSYEIQLDIIGIGGSPLDVNEPQLRKMASVVNGETRYWFIRNVGELVKKFKVLALRELR
ncbi:MAG: vWA domain-containing protein [Paludibacter sp.]